MPSTVHVFTWSMPRALHSRMGNWPVNGRNLKERKPGVNFEGAVRLGSLLGSTGRTLSGCPSCSMSAESGEEARPLHAPDWVVRRARVSNTSSPGNLGVATPGHQHGEMLRPNFSLELHRPCTLDASRTPDRGGQLLTSTIQARPRPPSIVFPCSLRGVLVDQHGAAHRACRSGNGLPR